MRRLSAGGISVSAIGETYCPECAVHSCGDCDALCLCMAVTMNGEDRCEHCPDPVPSVETSES